MVKNDIIQSVRDSTNDLGSSINKQEEGEGEGKLELGETVGWDGGEERGKDTGDRTEPTRDLDGDSDLSINCNVKSLK